jgi:spermidine synthase
MQTMFEQLGSRCSQNSSRVLVLGLGGGELSQYLLHHCPGMHVDAVELSSDVISLARNYFGLGESEQKFAERLNIEHADALTAVEERALTAQYSYDTILVDCFSGKGEVPETCRSRDLAQKVKELLKPTGVFLQNIWHYSKQNEAVHAEFENTKAIYHEVFDGALEDVSVPMPPQIRWVDIMKATRKR